MRNEFPSAFSGFGWLILPAFALAIAILIVFGKPMYFAAALGGMILLPIFFYSPRLALLVTVAAIPLEEAGVLSPDSLLGRISLAKIFGALALLSWVLNVLAKKQPMRVPPAIWWLLAYLAVGLLSLFGANDPGSGKTMLLRWTNTILFFLMVYNLVDSRLLIKRLLLTFLVISTAISAFALLQRVMPQFQYEQRGAQEIADTVEFGAQVDVIEEDLLGKSVLRSGGTSYHPLILALNCTILLPLLIVAVTRARGKPRFFAALALIINFAALLATGSRSGIVSCALMLLVLLFKGVIRPNRFMILGVLLIPFLVFPLLPADLKDRLFSVDSYQVDRSSSLGYRVEMFKAGLSVWSDHPLLGAGLGNLTDMTTRMESDVLSGLASGVHNMYLQIAVETGLAGLCVMMIFLLGSLRIARQMEQRALTAGDEPLRYLAQALSGCVWVLLIFGLSLDVMNFGLKNAWLLLSLLHVLPMLLNPKETPGALVTTPYTADSHK